MKGPGGKARGKASQQKSLFKLAVVRKDGSVAELGEFEAWSTNEAEREALLRYSGKDFEKTLLTYKGPAV